MGLEPTGASQGTGNEPSQYKQMVNRDKNRLRELQEGRAIMEEREDKIREATIQVIIGYMGICHGYDSWTREELEEELRYLLEEAA